MPLTLLRHTATPAGAGRCYGRLDLDVGPDFAAEAEAALAPLSPPRRIVTSPRLRCRRLAERAATRFGAPVTVEPALAEIDFGRWEGLAWDAVPREELDAWAGDLLDARPHGGESVRQLAARAGPALTRLAAEGAPVLAVTHAGVLRVAAALLGRPDPWRSHWPHGGALVFEAAAPGPGEATSAD